MEQNSISVILLKENSQQVLDDSIECILAQNNKPREIVFINKAGAEANSGLKEQLAQVGIDSIEISVSASATPCEAILEGASYASGTYCFSMRAGDRISSNAFEIASNALKNLASPLCILSNTVAYEYDEEPKSNPARVYDYPNWRCSRNNAVASLVRSEILPLDRIFGVLFHCALINELQTIHGGDMAHSNMLLELIELSDLVTFCYEASYCQPIEATPDSKTAMLVSSIIVHQKSYLTIKNNYPMLMDAFFGTYYHYLDKLKDCFKQSSHASVKEVAISIKKELKPFFIDVAKKEVSSGSTSLRMNIANKLFFSSPEKYWSIFNRI